MEHGKLTWEPDKIWTESVETKAKGDARTAGSNKFPRYVHQNLQPNQRHMNPQWQENECQYISSFKSAYHTRENWTGK